MNTGKLGLLKRSFTLLSIILIALASFTRVYGNTTAPPEYQNRILTYRNAVGHRGAMDLAPEGTIACFQAAKDAGYRQFECDVWYTRSGEFFICHDNNIRRFTGVNMDTWKLSSANRKRYPITRGRNVNNYPVQYFLKLQEVLSFCEKNGMCPWLHLKVSNGHTFSGKALKKMNRILKNYHGLKPLVFTGNSSLIKRMKKYSWRKGFLYPGYSYSTIKKKLIFAKMNHCKILIIPYSRSHKPSLKLIRRVHKYKIQTAFYRIRSKDAVRQVLNRGGDFCITDKVFFE